MKKILSITLALLMVASLSMAVFAAETEVPYDSSWVVTASSDIGNTVLKAFDKNTKTYWHTKYTAADGKITGKDECPHTITIVFPSEKTISGWKYTPRVDNSNGTIKEYNIYASADGVKFEKIYTGSFDYVDKDSVARDPKSASWGDMKMKAIKIEATKTVAGYGTAAEINFYTGGSGKPNASGTLVESGASTGTSDSGVSGTAISYESSWAVTASSDMGNTILKAFDKNTKTYWHSKYTVEDGKITGKDECPHTITIVFPSEKTISGWKYTPRVDNSNGTIKEYNIYASADGVKFEKIYTGSFDYVDKDSVARDPDGASWGDMKMKAIKIEATKTVAGYGTAAEIELYTGGTGSSNASGTLADDKSKDKSEDTVPGRTASDGTPLLDKTGWKAEVNSEMWSSVGKILDNNISTYWHSKYVAEGPTVVSHDNPPYHLKVNLPNVVTTSGIVLAPRTDSTNGRIMQADIYVSDSDDGEYFLLKDGLTFQSKSPSPQEIEFTANIKVKRVWVEITSSDSGYGTLAEFDLIKAKDDIETVKYEEYAANEEKNQLYEIDRKNFTAEFAGENWGGNTPVNLFDDSLQTFWQTDSSFTDWPAVLTVDLKSVYGVKEMRYTPRQSGDHHGCWLNVTINGSADGEEWQVLKENLKLEESLQTTKIILDNEAYVRYVEFQINEGVDKKAGGAELEFYQSKTAKDAHEAANREKYVLRIGSNIIESTKGYESKQTEIDVAPYIVNGSTMIPLRGLMEEMGATVTWNGEDETIYIDNGVNKIKLQIWNYNVVSYGTKYGDLIYSLLNPPIIKDSRTFIPIRFVSEQLGYKVSWDAETQTVTIEK